MERHVFVRTKDVEKIASAIKRAYGDGFEVKVWDDVIEVAPVMRTGDDEVDSYDVYVKKTHIMVVVPDQAEESFPDVVSELIDEFGWENVRWL